MLNDQFILDNDHPMKYTTGKWQIYYTIFDLTRLSIL